LFLFLLFGILGIKQFQGAFYQHCRIGEPGDFEEGVWTIDESFGRLCRLDGGGPVCPQDTVCGTPEQRELPNSSDRLVELDFINYGVTTFDNLPSSFVVMF
jgi:hypothetical protein